MVEKDFKKMLYENALKVNVQLSDSQLDLFYKYKELVIEWNKNINLTAITDDVDFAVKHFVDSITIDKYISNDNEKIIDIGTGAGFPGIPLKILRTNNEIVLFRYNFSSGSKLAILSS